MKKWNEAEWDAREAWYKKNYDIIELSDKFLSSEGLDQKGKDFLTKLKKQLGVFVKLWKKHRVINKEVEEYWHGMVIATEELKVLYLKTYGILISCDLKGKKRGK